MAKIHYQAIAKTFFVPAATVAVFSAFSQPLPPKKVVDAGTVNAPVQQARPTFPFSQFSQPQFVRSILPAEQPNTIFEERPPPAVTPVFTPFSQPVLARQIIPDEQPSALFETLPGPPPFTGFIKFSQPLPFRPQVQQWAWAEFAATVEPPDTHDGVWVKRKKKRSGKDPIDLELDRRAILRSQLEQAAYPPPQIKYDFETKPKVPPPPPNVTELAETIVRAQQRDIQQRVAKLAADDEDDIAMILRDL